MTTMTVNEIVTDPTASTLFTTNPVTIEPNITIVDLTSASTETYNFTTAEVFSTSDYELATTVAYTDDVTITTDGITDIHSTAEPFIFTEG